MTRADPRVQCDFFLGAVCGAGGGQKVATVIGALVGDCIATLFAESFVCYDVNAPSQTSGAVVAIASNTTEVW